jgi:hypothetical protein
MNIKPYPLKRGQWFGDLTDKKFVVWHGTAGRTLHTPVTVAPAKRRRRSTAGTTTPIASARRGWSIATARSTRPSTIPAGSFISA